jgi:hypothetical protein
MIRHVSPPRIKTSQPRNDPGHSQLQREETLPPYNLYHEDSTDRQVKEINSRMAKHFNHQHTMQCVTEHREQTNHIISGQQVQRQLIRGHINPPLGNFPPFPTLRPLFRGHEERV